MYTVLLMTGNTDNAAAQIPDGAFAARAVRYRDELRLLRRGEAAVYTVGGSLAAGWLCWSYLFGRTLEVGPSTMALGAGALGLVILGFPSAVVLLVTMFILSGERSLKRIGRSVVMLTCIAVVSAEAWVSAQDIMLQSRNVSNETWDARWFPFGHRRIVYFDSTGWQVID